METKYHSNSLHQVLPASNQPNAQQQQQKEIIQCSIEVHGLNILSNFRLQVFHKIRIPDWECYFCIKIIYGLDFFFFFKFNNFAAIIVLSFVPYTWNMDFIRSYFGTNEPVLIWKKVRTKAFNWSEVHLYRSDFLQNPYFTTCIDNNYVWYFS